MPKALRTYVLLIAIACLCGAIVNAYIFSRQALPYISRMSVFRRVELGMNRHDLEGLLSDSDIGIVLSMSNPDGGKYIFDDPWWMYRVDVDSNGRVFRKFLFSRNPRPIFH